MLRKVNTTEKGPKLNIPKQEERKGKSKCDILTTCILHPTRETRCHASQHYTPLEMMWT